LRRIANPSVGILLFAFAFLGFVGHRSVDAAESTADVDCIWISAAELAGKPMSGPAWDALEAAANGDHGLPDVGAFDSKHDTLTLAVALVYARTGDAFYRTKARDAILSAIGTESTTVQAVQPCRNVVSYVISADLIDLSGLDPLGDTAFRAWIDQIRFVVWPDGSMIEEDSERANNHGRMCGMSRAAAIAVYLEDWGELDSTAQVFAGFLGDRQTDDDFAWKHELSWQNDETNPVGINPVGSEKQGLSIDGALPEEMRRGGPFAIPPIQTGYPWEALQGILVEAVILDRAGYAVFDWSDQAILRSVEFVERLDTQYPQDGWWATGDDTWSPWLINAIYQTDFRTEPAAMGKCMGWTDWTHAPDVAEPTPVPAISRRGLSLLAGLLVASGTFCLMPVGRSSSMRNRATRSRTRSGLPSVGKPHIRHLMRKV
jgi:hypothetical protein